jgi:peptidoglycan/LPS O-acetylase OafA/YrhL
VSASLSLAVPEAAHPALSRLRNAAPSYDYIPVLDGLRGVSIAIVLISHYGLPDLMPAGFGVNVFFFISGLLISRQLSVELAARGRLNFGKFYLRRAARLFPALLLMVPIGALIYTAMGQKMALSEILSALFYYSNYYGYFVGFSQPDPLVPHPYLTLWSLAVEEHFYLLFPLLIALFFRRGRLYLGVLVALLVAVPLWRFHLYTLCAGDGGHPAICGITPFFRIYGGTDTRADALLYGVLLTELLRQPRTQRLVALMASPLAVAAGMALILLSLAVRNDAFRDVYRYSIQSLGLMPIIAGLVFTDQYAWARRLLETRPAILVGRWSYSLYLNHWMAMTLAGGLTLSMFTLAWYAIAVPACLTLSLFSYYAVEMPVVGLRRRLGSHVVTAAA